MADDLTFTFDTGPFEKGINRVTKGLAGIESTTSNVAKGVARGLTKMALGFGSIVVGAKAVQGALKAMPEIGQTFGIAKDIFTKNLLFPLRREVFPLLQSLLDWVRDSRGRFTKWGENLANIFRAVVSGIKSLVGFMKKGLDQVTIFAERIFGQRMKSINDLFNLISFKAAVMVQYVSSVIESFGALFRGMFSGLGDIGSHFRSIGDSLNAFLKIFTATNGEGDSFKEILTSVGEIFGNILHFITAMTDSFLQGFVPAVSGVMTPINGIVKAMGDILNSLFGGTNEIQTWESIFKGIGTVLGTTILVSLRAIESVLNGIRDFIEWFKAEGLSAQDFSGHVSTARDSSKSGVERFLAGLSAAFAGGAGMTAGMSAGPGIGAGVPSRSVQDAVIKPDGTVIETARDDTLIATKNPVSMVNEETRNQRSMTMTVSPTIVIQQGTESSGREVARGLMDELRDQFEMEFTRGGF